MNPPIIHRLSRSVRWLQDRPLARQGDHLYFRLSFNVKVDGLPAERHYYAKVRGKRVRYWLDHLLNFTAAHEVEHITREIA